MSRRNDTPCKACGHPHHEHKEHQYSKVTGCRHNRSNLAMIAIEGECACPAFTPPWAGPGTPCRACGHLYARHVPEACGECPSSFCGFFVPPVQDPDQKVKCAGCPHPKFIHRGERCNVRIGGGSRRCACGGFAYPPGSAAEPNCAFEQDDETFFQVVRGAIPNLP